MIYLIWTMHLQEGFWKLFYVFLGFLLRSFLCLTHMAHSVFILARPLINLTPQFQVHFIFTEIAEAFHASILISILLATTWSVPLWLYHRFTFFAPSLYFFEWKNWWFSMLLISCFYIFSHLIAFFIVLPTFWLFFLGFEQVSNIWVPSWALLLRSETRIYPYVLRSWYIWMIIQGICQLPVLIWWIIRFNWCSVQLCLYYRRTIWFCLCLNSALICPPDVILQIWRWLGFCLSFECLCWWWCWMSQKAPLEQSIRGFIYYFIA